jgi:hypothetical protein
MSSDFMIWEIPASNPSNKIDDLNPEEISTPQLVGRGIQVKVIFSKSIPEL